MWTTLTRLGVVALLASLLGILAPASAQQAAVPPFDRKAQPGNPPAVPGQENQPEVLAHGPIHEAYAQPNVPPRPSVTVSKKPPDPIQETPPDEKPEGDNVVWIPGYWSWGDDRSDFIWVSGFWRVAPAGRKWVPGYWTQTDSGWQWVSGLWADGSQPDVPYSQEPPPASLEAGPSSPSPGDDYLYAPGNWLYQGDQFVWSPGFWYRPRLGLLYCPPRWCWTPNGYLCNNGYWDYPLESRGVLFAPCYIPRALWAQPGWFFRPFCTVNVPALLASLWVRPNFGCYAFGDYYAGRYARLGYQPWLGWGPRYRDSLYDYYRWAHRGNPGWRQSLVSLYNGRVRGEFALPPRTFAGQRALAANGRTLPSSLQVVRPLNQFSSSHLRLTKASTTEVLRNTRYTQSIRRATAERRSLETRGASRVLTLNRVPGHAGFRSAQGAVRTLPRTGPGTNPPSVRPNYTPRPNSLTAPRPSYTPRPNTPTAPRPYSRPYSTPQRPLRNAQTAVPRSAPRAAPGAAPRAAPRYSPPPRAMPRMNTAPRRPAMPRYSPPRPAAPRMTAPRPPSRSPAPRSAPRGGTPRKH
jgi:hypothetical protein